jgi:hypothetical protein
VHLQPKQLSHIVTDDKKFCQTFADRFSKTHPAFIWAFRATRDWPELDRLIPSMKEHLISNESTRHHYCQDGFTTDDGPGLGIDFDLIFKELFCIAAQKISEQIHESLDNVGVLFGDIMTTGTYITPTFLQRFNPFQSKTVTTESADPETGDTPHLIGKGQFFFLVRRLNKQEASSFAATGFRFAAIQKIAHILASSMQVTKKKILNQLALLQQYSTGEKMMEPGLYIVCFSLRPTIRTGCDVLVLKDTTNLLPFVTLPIDTIVQWQLDILSQMDGWTLLSCLKWLKANSGSGNPEDSLFCRQMHEAISKLAAMIQDPTFGQATFSCEQIMVPCRSTTKSLAPGVCSVFSFQIVMPPYTTPTSPQLSLVPLCFFKAQQQVYAGVADHQNFVHDLHREFAHFTELRNERRAYSAASSATPPSAALSQSVSAGSSQRRQSRSHLKSPSTAISRVFSGILSSKLFTVNAIALQRDELPLERQDLGMLIDGGSRYYSRTFVDELCTMCRTRLNGVQSSRAGEIRGS